jgi:hypothetical protein
MAKAAPVFMKAMAELNRFEPGRFDVALTMITDRVGISVVAR